MNALFQPKISIGIVVYNGIKFIGRALDSVVNQSYTNIELIVVDGGSQDGTQTVLKNYAGYISVLISEPDMGIYDAMNKARSLATGDWLLFLGCDDVLKDDISSIVRSLNRPETVYYGDVIRRSQGVVSGGRFSKYRLMNRNFCHQAVFYPRQVYRQYAYSLDYPWLADYAYNIRLYGADIPFVYLNIVVTLYNDKGGSSFGDAAFERDKLRLIRESFGTAYWMIKAIRNVFERIVRIVINRPLPTDRTYKS